MNPSGPDPFTDDAFPSAIPPQVPQTGFSQLGAPGSQYPGAYSGTSHAAAYGGYAPYHAGYAGYGSAMLNGTSNGYVPGGYGAGIGSGGPRYGSAVYGMHQTQAGGAAIISGMQEAMQRFARVSGLLEEVLRNLHLLFDGIFGLGYSVMACYDEARLWLAVKSGPAAFVFRLFCRLRRIWRLLVLFICSPMAGRYSPVALVLQILGLVPAESTLALEQDGIPHDAPCAQIPSHTNSEPGLSNSEPGQISRFRNSENSNL